MIEKLLSVPAIRRKLAFHLRSGHYDELNISVPIGCKLTCPILHPDYWWSFQEVFFTDEYQPVFEQIPLPSRWLDLGCHAGFFSLLVVQQRRRLNLPEPAAALLVDGDSRVARSISQICEQNKLGNQLQFLHGAVASKPGDIFFHETVAMSSAISNGESAGSRRVPVARPEQIVTRLEPPYDLVKVDVEGAEHDFLTTYEPILSKTRHLLLEWHSWHSGGGGVATIRSAAAAAGFKEIRDIIPEHKLNPTSDRTCGVILFESTR